jgi:hypothetical protein
VGECVLTLQMICVVVENIKMDLQIYTFSTSSPSSSSSAICLSSCRVWI